MRSRILPFLIFFLKKKLKIFLGLGELCVGLGLVGRLVFIGSVSVYFPSGRGVRWFLDVKGLLPNLRH